MADHPILFSAPILAISFTVDAVGPSGAVGHPSAGQRSVEPGCAGSVDTGFRVVAVSGMGGSGRRGQKLELTWVGKEDRPRLEPRILVEDPALSHAASARREGDLFDNRLIQGDNLLALKALEAEFAGKVKCVFIDPPYNTGSAFEHYDDGLEHSLWLTMMRDRLEIIRDLLADNGSLWKLYTCVTHLSIHFSKNEQRSETKACRRSAHD